MSAAAFYFGIRWVQARLPWNCRERALNFIQRLQTLTLQAKNQLSDFLACSPGAHTTQMREAIEEVVLVGHKIGGARQKPEPECARPEGIVLFIVAGVLSTLIFALPPILSLDRGQKRVETCLQ